MNIDFAGRVVLVAGGTGGLGRALCLAFLHEGARVIVPYHAEKEFLALKGLSGERAVDLEGYEVNVADEAATAEVVAQVTRRHGALDVLVNAIGGYSGGQTLWETEPDILDRMLALNLRSAYSLTRAAVPVMLQAAHGSVVNIAAKAAVDHAAGASAYAASKAAALALMDSLAADIMGTGVRVNSVLPSIIDTPANRKAMPGGDFRTWPKPEDIAKVVLFLSSNHAAVIHGAAIPVYGAL